MDIDLIQMLWQAGDVEFTDEALDRMDQRGITVENIGQAIMGGRIIEERPRARPHAKCTVQGWANRKIAGLDIGLYSLNVACAVTDMLRIITVYWERTL
ncbi:DUF4258 domain-containing protein [Candidatus Poribacteria bacterium]|nr:DUF4258 domain-containing protein [Candidatus Poribacteria bacterium]